MKHSDNAAQRLQLAYQLAFGRLPRTAELEHLLAFVEPPRGGWQGSAELTTWTDALHALINTTEFRFRR
jgi:molybdenum-dependent DNA-binding transcriptional regulator ModE